MDIQKLFEESTGYSTSSWVVFDKELNKYVAIDGELILTVEEMNLDFELFQKGIAIGGQAAKADVVPEISNKIVIGTQVKIVNPDDTVEYGVVSGDEGVVVWVGEFGTVFGVCIPKKGDVWSFEFNQLEITSDFAVPECTWSPDQNEEMWGNWHTSCGGIFTLNEGTPTENRLNHCCYCGGLLVEAQESIHD